MPFSSSFTYALKFASDLHQDQVRKSTKTPYMGHLLGVASLVIDHGGTEDEAIAALLHDAIEDQGGKETRQKILDAFGENVVRIIDGCTDADVKPKPPWRERKEKHIAHVKQADESQILVLAADKMHNLRDLLGMYRYDGESVWSIFNGGKEGTLWYYRAFYLALRERHHDLSVSRFSVLRLLVELNRVRGELDKLVDAHEAKLD